MKMKALLEQMTSALAMAPQPLSHFHVHLQFPFQLEISGKKAVPHTEPRDANKSQSWRARELGGTPTPEVWTQATAAPGPLLPSTGPPVL